MCVFFSVSQMLKRNGGRAAGSVIILISQGTVSTTDLESSLDLMKREEITVAAIEYPSLGMCHGFLVYLCVQKDRRKLSGKNGLIGLNCENGKKSLCWGMISCLFVFDMKVNRQRIFWIRLVCAWICLCGKTWVEFCDSFQLARII